MDHLLSREATHKRLGSIECSIQFWETVSLFFVTQKVFQKWIMRKEKLRNKERKVNALALGADEGRDEQRYASGSRK